MGGRGKEPSRAVYSGFRRVVETRSMRAVLLGFVDIRARACWIVLMSIPSAVSFMLKASPSSEVVTAPLRE